MNIKKILHIIIHYYFIYLIHIIHSLPLAIIKLS